MKPRCLIHASGVLNDDNLIHPSFQQNRATLGCISSFQIYAHLGKVRLYLPCQKKNDSPAWTIGLHYARLSKCSDLSLPSISIDYEIDIMLWKLCKKCGPRVQKRSIILPYKRSHPGNGRIIFITSTRIHQVCPQRSCCSQNSLSSWFPRKYRNRIDLSHWWLNKVMMESLNVTLFWLVSRWKNLTIQ